MLVARRRAQGLSPRGLAAGVLGSLAVVLPVAGVWLARVNGQALTDSAVGFSLPFVTFAVVGTVLLWKRPGNRIGWVLLLGPLSVLLYGASEEYARYGLVTAPGVLPGADVVSSLRTPLWVPGAASVLVFLPLLFPTGALPTHRWRPVAWLAAAVSVVLVVIQWGASWSYRGPALLDPRGAWIETSALAGLVEPIFPLLLLCAIAAFSSLVRRFRRAEDMERMQIKWVLYSVGIFLVAIVGDMATRGEGWLSPFWTVVLIPVSVGVAILRYRLYEIDRIINRTVTYVIVVTVLALIYLGAVLGLGSLAQTLFGAGSNDLIVAVSTLLVAAAFHPVRGRVRARVDRRFNRAKVDAAQEVERFGARLRDRVALEDVVGETVGAAVRTVQPAGISLWVRSGGSP